MQTTSWHDRLDAFQFSLTVQDGDEDAQKISTMLETFGDRSSVRSWRSSVLAVYFTVVMTFSTQQLVLFTK